MTFKILTHYRVICFSGHVQWKIQLEGRIECSAAILGDFSQVVLWISLPLQLRLWVWPNLSYATVSSFSHRVPFLGCCWMLQRKDIFYWFFKWQYLLDFRNFWWGMAGLMLKHYGFLCSCICDHGILYLSDGWKIHYMKVKSQPVVDTQNQLIW